MDVRALGPVAGVLGGLCWAALWAADMVGGNPGWDGPVRWVGLGLLGIALATVGAGLVSRSALWLRLIVAVAFPLLVWSIYTVVRGSGEDPTIDGVTGLLAVLLSAGVVVAARRTTTSRTVERGGRHGSHAAR